MRLSAPKKIVFLVALIVAIVSVLGAVGILPDALSFFANQYYWLMTGSFVLLALGNLLKGF